MGWNEVKKIIFTSEDAVNSFWIRGRFRERHVLRHSKLKVWMVSTPNPLGSRYFKNLRDLLSTKGGKNKLTCFWGVTLRGPWYSSECLWWEGWWVKKKKTTSHLFPLWVEEETMAFLHRGLSSCLYNLKEFAAALWCRTKGCWRVRGWGGGEGGEGRGRILLTPRVSIRCNEAPPTATMS